MSAKAHVCSGRKALLWLPLLLYAAALNPYFLPETFDNVIYHVGGVSIAEHHAFLYQDKYNITWAPGLPALLALPYTLGLQSPWTAKAVILLCVAAGLFLVHRLLVEEGREYPTLTTVICALLPCGYMMGTRIASEWPYIAASFLFLLCLEYLRRAKRTLRFAMVTGGLLGIAALTRFVGVLLGAAVVAQAVTIFRAGARPRSYKTVLPEGIVAAVGGGMFLLWRLRSAWHVANGTAAAERYYHGTWYLDVFRDSGFATVPGKISDLLFYAERILQTASLGGRLAFGFATLLGLVAVVGLLARLASAKRTPSDWYTLAVIVLFAFQNTNQQVRYLLPVAPFLVDYFLSGVTLGARAAALRDTRLFRPALYTGCAVWLAALAVLDGYLLVFGNGETHAGLCIAASPNAESFYLGQYRDLYAACQYLKDSPASGPVAVLGGKGRYVHVFTGRTAVALEPGQPVSCVVVEQGEQLPQETQDALGLTETSQFGGVTVYETRPNPARSP